MKNNIKQFLIAGVTILLLTLYAGVNNPSPVSGGAADKISGYGWEADTGPTGTDFGGLGWLSFNCLSGGDCNTANYGVTIDSLDGSITGYAWAGNSVDSNINGIGWIKFGGLSGFPTGSGTTTNNAKLNGTVVSGWARACAVFQTGCDGDYYHAAGPINNNPATNTYLGGWDGWISLSGTGYGVSLDQGTGAFSGYAWGSADGLGWIDFSQVNTTSSVLGLDFYAVPSAAYANDYTTRLFWGGAPAGTVLTNCVADSAPPLNTAIVPSWNGGVADTPPQASLLVNTPYNPTKYKITCTNQATQTPVTSTISVSRSPFPQETISLLSNGVTANKTTLSWTTKNIVFNSCTASGGWTGVKTTTPSGSTSGKNSEADVDVPNTAPAYTTYNLTCTGSYTGNQIVVSLDLNELSGPTVNQKQPQYIER